MCVGDIKWHHQEQSQLKEETASHTLNKQKLWFSYQKAVKGWEIDKLSDVGLKDQRLGFPEILLNRWEFDLAGVYALWVGQNHGWKVCQLPRWMPLHSIKIQAIA